jgi:hypothetical protein
VLGSLKCELGELTVAGVRGGDVDDIDLVQANQLGRRADRPGDIVARGERLGTFE